MCIYIVVDTDSVKLSMTFINILTQHPPLLFGKHACFCLCVTASKHHVRAVRAGKKATGRCKIGASGLHI